MDDRQKEAERIVKELEESTFLTKIEELIKDNKISFTYKDKKYRVRLLTLGEKEELDGLRRSKFGELLQDKNILLEKDLILQYKARGIDIEELNNKFKKIDAEEKTVRLKLGEATEKNQPKQTLDIYHDQINDFQMQKNILQAQRTLLLEFSLENQLLNYVAQIITYLSLESLVDGEWNRVFKSLAEFKKYEDEELVTLAARYSMTLQYL